MNGTDDGQDAEISDAALHVALSRWIERLVRDGDTAGEPPPDQPRWLKDMTPAARAEWYRAEAENATRRHEAHQAGRAARPPRSRPGLRARVTARMWW